MQTLIHLHMDVYWRMSFKEERSFNLDSLLVFSLIEKGKENNKGWNKEKNMAQHRISWRLG